MSRYLYHYRAPNGRLGFESCYGIDSLAYMVKWVRGEPLFVERSDDPGQLSWVRDDQALADATEQAKALP